jgi:hypothetical protein
VSDELPDKVRIRSEDELAAQGRGLAALSEALAAAGLPHFVSGGTLLGAVRDGDFIAWDWDVEVSVRSEEAVGRLDAAAAALREAGFEVRAVDADPANLKIVAVREGATFEVRGYRRRGELRVRRDFRTRDRFFDGATEVVLRGRTYPCLGPVDAYLTDRYGDWRTPVRSATKSEYLAPNYFARSGARRRLAVLSAAAVRRLRRLIPRPR